MVLLYHEAQVEGRFIPVRIVLILIEDRCTVALFVPYARKLFLTHPMELLGDVGHVKSRIGPFGDRVSVGVRCTACAKCTIGSEIIFGHTQWYS
jgi:hypothetical protein